MNNQDVYKWYYKDDYIANKSEPYWCCSQIAIFNGRYLVDTFWGGSDNRYFKPENLEDKIEVVYLGNLLDFKPANESDQAMYDDKDFLNLNHSNSSRGNCYLRKGAVKSKEKMHKIIKRNAAKLKADYEYAKKAYQWELDKLGYEELEYVSALDGVSLADESYEDAQFKGD